MTYRIELTRAAVRDLTALPKPLLKRLDACIQVPFIKETAAPPNSSRLPVLLYPEL